MREMTKNDARVLLTLFKDISNNYNANSLSKRVGLTSMGTLKILKNLEKQGILASKKLGKAVFYSISFNDYTRSYLIFLLQKEAEESIPRIRRWVKELRKIKGNAEICILFGSLLKKQDYDDIDALLVLKQSQNRKANELLDEMGKLSTKKIHAVKQTEKDIKNNLKKHDKVMLNALNGSIVVFGYKKLVEIIENVTGKE